MSKNPDSKKVSLRLSENNTVRLIQLYQSEPCLYDVKSDDYKNRDLRAAAVKRIAAAFSVEGFGPKEVVVKFKNLRNSYSQELKKIEDSEKSTTRADHVYVPKVHWFDVMDSFLRPQMYVRPSKTNLEFKQTRQTSDNYEHSKNVSEDVSEPEDEKLNFTEDETVNEKVSTLHEDLTSTSSQQTDSNYVIQSQALTVNEQMSILRKDEHDTSTFDQQAERNYVIQSQIEGHSPENNSSSAGDNFQSQRRASSVLRKKTVPIVSKLGWVKKKKLTSRKRVISHQGTSQVSALTRAVDKLIEVSQLAVSAAAKNHDLYNNFGQFVAGVLRQAGGQKAIVMTNEITNVLMRHMALPAASSSLSSKQSPFTLCPQTQADRILLNHTSSQRHKK
ncbi:uncharacterized protein [Anabrus simplex]|uniref:uncharacterized protein n=1 Tax=Anabrus simplex TaxID=316456 RepID=UPI0035A2D18A